jgi:hypothetical protein
MKIPFNSRKWHAWLSFALALPILMVAITAIFIAHGQALGFRDIKVDASWLPGYSRNDEKREVRAVLATADTLWIGTQVGLLQKTAAGVHPVAAFEGQEIRALLFSSTGVVVMTAQGLFAERDRQWIKISRAPVVSAYADNGMLFAVFRGKSLQMSNDGGASWQPLLDAQAALAELPALRSGSSSMMLARVIRDLHTGEALLGHDAEWIWNDIVGGAMTFLAATGLYLWWRGQRKLVFARRVMRR